MLLFLFENYLAARNNRCRFFISSLYFCPFFFRSIVFIFLLIPSGSLPAQTRPVRELAPGVFYYFGDELQQKSANCTWIVFKDFVFVIDANYPWGATGIIREIRKTSGKPIRFLFDTHYHHDHSFGNSVFADSGATIVSTRITADEMHTLGKYEWDHGSEYSGRI